jgi:hypothetical protein
MRVGADSKTGECVRADTTNEHLVDRSYSVYRRLTTLPEMGAATP